MEKANRPSNCQLMLMNSKYPRPELTDCTHDLTLDTELILISPSNPTNSPTLSDSDIRRILDPIPHVPRRECQDEDNGKHTPDDPRLDQG